MTGSEIKKARRAAVHAEKSKRKLANDKRRDRNIQFPGRVVRPDNGIFTRFASNFDDHHNSMEFVGKSLPADSSVTANAVKLSKAESKGIVHNTGYKSIKHAGPRTSIGQKEMYQAMKGRHFTKMTGKQEPFHGVHNDRFN